MSSPLSNKCFVRRSGLPFHRCYVNLFQNEWDTILMIGKACAVCIGKKYILGMYRDEKLKYFVFDCEKVQLYFCAFPILVKLTPLLKSNSIT